MRQLKISRSLRVCLLFFGVATGACSFDSGVSNPATDVDLGSDIDLGGDSLDADMSTDFSDIASDLETDFEADINIDIDDTVDAPLCMSPMPYCAEDDIVECVEELPSVVRTCPGGCAESESGPACACFDTGDCLGDEYCGNDSICHDNPCGEASTLCVDGVFITCGDDGSPSDEEDCGDQQCGEDGCFCKLDEQCDDDEFCEYDGVCELQICEPNAAYCEDEELIRCDARGAREGRTECLSGLCDEGACICADEDDCASGEVCSATGQCICDSGVSCGLRSLCCPSGDVCVTIESCDGETCVTDDRCLPPCDAGERCGALGELCCSGDNPVCHASNSCVPDCGDGTVCGADLDICCDAGDICAFDECRSPGLNCVDFRDCDYGEYCEPLLGQCLPNYFPPGLVCREEHEFDDFDPAIAWHWVGTTLGETTYDNVLGFPAVADMDGNDVPDVIVQAYDSLGDGVIAVIRGDTGETVYVNPTEDLHGAGHVAVANIDDDPYPEIATTLANGVGLIEDIVNCEEPEDEGGCYRWTVASGTLDRRLDGGAPFFADFNADGLIEVVFGSVVIDAASGDVIVDGGDASTAAGSIGGQFIAAAADVNDDGVPELLTGDCAWQVDFDDGLLDEIWCNPDFTNGFPGVIDIVESPAGTGQPEVVVVVDGDVYILRGDNGLGSDADPFQDPDYLYRFDLPGGGHGGPPNIADFDGDGRPEIGTAGSGCYAVLDVDCIGSVSGDQPGCDRPEFPDCTPGTDCLVEPCPVDDGAGDGVLWAILTNDDSSETTGSSVFDFQGDGNNEVLYNDQCRFLALDGATAQPFLSRFNSSRTNSEYPIVVDVNGDRRTEILLVANDDGFTRDCEDYLDPAGGRPDLFPECYPAEGDRPDFCDEGTRGVFAFGDPDDKWVRTRAIWNQHAYSITNIEDNASVPEIEDASWESFNTYRANRQGEVPLNAPDPAITDFSYSARSCPPELHLIATVANSGTRGMAAGLPVSLYRTDGDTTLLETKLTTVPVFPGGTTTVTFIYVLPIEDIDDTMSFRVVANDDGTGVGPEVDCDPLSNEAVLDDVECRISGPK